MRDRRVLVVIVGIAAVLTAGVPAAADAATGGAAPALRTAAGAGAWGKPMKVPGLAALKGTKVEVDWVGCGSPGNCAAGGDYKDGHHNLQGFVVDERHGRWSKAIPVPGLAHLNEGGGAAVEQVACGPARNCLAGGSYAYDETGSRFSSFLDVERGGRWSKVDDLNGDGDVYTISCSSAGNCVAGGIGSDGLGNYPFVGDAYVVEEQAGRIGPVTFIPGLRKLEHFADPEIVGSWVDSVDCPSAGNCAAAGAYLDKRQRRHGFVAVEQKGSWDKAIEVPGLAALDKGKYAEVYSVSCGPADNCVASGSADGLAFVTVEVNGSWSTAMPVPGLNALNNDGLASVDSISCGSADNCTTAGSYKDSHRHWQAFVASENNGVWSKAIPLPGVAALNKGGNAGIDELSCPSAGNCAAGGSYADRPHHFQGFVIIERNGAWGRPTPVPGLRALNKGGNAGFYSVSCHSPGHCAAGGYYSDRRNHFQGFVVTQTH